METPACFITGSTGFLGQHLAAALAEHFPTAELRLLVRRPRAPWLPPALSGRVRLVEGDLAAPETYATALAGVGTVVHSAALISFRPEQRAEVYRTNVAGTRALVEAAAAAGCETFLHLSSISAIGRCPPALANETLYPTPEALARDPYGGSKLAAEREVLRYADRLRVTLLNPSVIIGPGSRLWARAMRWLRRAPALPMLTTRNSFVDARDVARAALLALNAPRSGERYIVTGANVSMLDFAQLLLRVLGSRAPVFPVPGALLRAGDAAIDLLDALRLNPGLRRPSALNVDKVYSIAKIQRDLGWTPAYSLEQSLRDTAAWAWATAERRP